MIGGAELLQEIERIERISADCWRRVAERMRQEGLMDDGLPGKNEFALDGFIHEAIAPVPEFADNHALRDQFVGTMMHLVKEDLAWDEKAV